MLGELRGEERTVGLIMLANRTGISRRFQTDDLALFDTLAANASAALQYDRLEQAVSDLSDLQEQLHHQAYHDPLTGLANRALFRDEVRAALDDGDERGIAVLFIDLDDFKAVNDTLGHAVGDELLRAAGRRLTRCTRDGDLVARLGGDEFAVMCRHPQEPERAGIDVARRVLDAFQVPVSVGSHLLPVRLSVGVATSEHSGGRTEHLLRDADVAMYEAKEAGKARYAVFDPAMRDVVVRRHGLRKELERALAGRELDVRFQPIIDLATGDTQAMEALVRWDHPERGQLAPIEFIPLAEETGLIVPLGRFVLEEACRRAQLWSTPGPALAVQVNLSARELEDERLIATVTAVLNETGIDPRRLVLEITETLLVRDAETRRHHADRPARSRRAAGARRLRNGLLVAQLPAHAAPRRAQDRQGVRRRDRRQRRGRRVRAPDHRAGRHGRPHRHRGGHRIGRAAARPAAARLRPGSGVPVRSRCRTSWSGSPRVGRRFVS